MPWIVCLNFNLSQQLPLIQRKQNKKHQKDCLVNCTLHPGFIDNVYWPCLTDIGAIVEHDNSIKKETETNYYKNYMPVGKTIMIFKKIQDLLSDPR